MMLEAEVLDVAVGAAREAGALIRAEFERATITPGQCSIDERAEVQICDRLRAAFPAWQFSGRETGTVGEPSDHHWLVDPHDGTSAFQRGYRGTAVSIALFRESRPVLGVVFAPCPAVGEQDLIAWAEGCAVTRNGVAIERRWPHELGRYDVILLSEHADQKPTVIAELTAPARFISVPSVAYRLALTAVGEGEAAVSVAETTDFDSAAGYAIVKGAGGLVLDADGREPRYALSEGALARSGGLLVGGAPRIVAELVHRSWSKVRAAPSKAVPFVFSGPKQVRSSGQLLDRAQGVMLGQLIGDALGAQVEFERAHQIADRFPDGVRTLRDGGPFNTLAGQPTDDSEMALTLARCLVHHGRFDVESVARAYVGWYLSDPFDVGRTIGQACSAGTRALNQGLNIAEAMRLAANPSSQANGAMMRISPLAILGHAHVDHAVHDAIEDATLTHPNHVCLAANAALVAAMVDGIRGGDPESMTQAAAKAAAPLQGAGPVVERIQLARIQAPILDGGNMGWVLLALQNAFFELTHAASCEEGLVRTVSRGGDTDTNGAIAGALLGAAHGASRIPMDWRKSVLSCRAGSGCPEPRAVELWAVDALRLSEALLSS